LPKIFLSPRSSEAQCGLKAEFVPSVSSGSLLSEKAEKQAKVVLYFLFSRHSQIANAAVAMHAAALIHIGISVAPAIVTFTCKISLNKCTIETSSRNITVIVVDGFIIVALSF
jgi:hypothetical protein